METIKFTRMISDGIYRPRVLREFTAPRFQITRKARGAERHQIYAACSGHVDGFFPAIENIDFLEADGGWASWVLIEVLPPSADGKYPTAKILEVLDYEMDFQGHTQLDSVAWLPKADAL